MKKNTFLVGLSVVVVFVLIFNIFKTDSLRGILKRVGNRGQQAAVNSVPTTIPDYYWRFEGGMTPTNGSGNYPVTGGSVATGCSAAGGCLNTTVSSVNGTFPSIGSVSKLSYEFLFKAGPRFETTIFFDDRPSQTAFSAMLEWPASGLTIPKLWFQVNGDRLSVDLTGIGQKRWGYFADGNFHHMVFTYDGASGKRTIYVDGVKFAEKTGTTGNVNLSSNNLYSGGLTSYERLSGSIDEVAIYKNVAIDPLLVAQHYQDAVVNGVAYNTTNTTVANVPAAPASTAGIDSSEYPVGYPTPGSMASATTQLKSYPLPRYKPGNTLMKNVDWIDGMYFGGRFQPGVSDPQAVTNSTTIKDELAKNWNYAVMINWSSGNEFVPAWKTLINNNPSYQFDFTTLRAQVNGGTKITNQTLPNDRYFQNASGSALVPAGCGTASGTKYWRAVPNFEADYMSDGTSAAGWVAGALSGLNADRKVRILNENGEVHLYYTNGCGSQDPLIESSRAAYNSANGTSLTTKQYIGEQYRRSMQNEYFTPIKNASPSRLTDTKFTLYQVSGRGEYAYDWSTARKINTPINGQYYSTLDFYQGFYGATGPNNWANGVGAGNGLGVFLEARKNEIALGDKLFSPFVAAGWMHSNIHPYTNTTYSQTDVRPGQWLGMLKLLGAIGAEFYYTGYFNEGGNYQNCTTSGGTCPALPQTYAWQAVMPSYAQGAMSRAEDLLRGTLITNTAGNLPAVYTNPTSNDGFLLATGDKTVPAFARQSGSKYLITAAVMRNHNMQESAQEQTKNVNVTVGGDNLRIQARQQGSMYVYDKSNTAAPIFYQIDGWHERAHPSYWTGDFSIEAEMPDSGTAQLVTYGPGVASKDFTPGNYTTAVKNASGTLSYNFQPRNAASSGTETRYLWFRANNNSTTAASTGSFAVDSGAAQTVSLPANSGNVWCNKNSAGQVMAFSVSQNADHQLKYTASNANLYVDQFVLTTNPNLGLGTCTGGAGTSDTILPSISITSPTTSATYSTSTPSITLSGSASDNVAVTSVVAVNAAAGASAISISGTTSWTGSVSLVSGLNSLVVTAYDAAGNQKQATLDVTYTPADTVLPNVSIVAPVASGGTYLATSNSLTTLAGTSSDNVGVTQVTWVNSLGGSGTATGTTSWSVPSIALSNGSNVITVTAKDAANNTKTASITVVRDTTAPTVSVTVPTAGASFTGTSPITLTANATDNVAIDHVDFYYGSNQFIGGATTVTGGNYTRTWTPSTSGSIGLYAIAYDTSGNPKTSATVTISVSLSTPDTIAPTVQMSAPAAGATVSGTAVTLGAVASDNTGVSSVAFYLDGVAISGAIDTTGNNPNTNGTGITGQLYEAVWNTSSVSNGTHTLSARATDAAGNIKNSSTVSITVSNVVGQPDLIVTDLSWTPASPVLGSVITFSAVVKNVGNAATPAGKVTSVTFYNNEGTVIGCGDSYTQSIAAGASITVTAGQTSSVTSNWCNTTLGGQIPPTWIATGSAFEARAEVDDINRITESNETNNMLTTVYNPPADTTAPTVAITSPTTSATYSSTSATLANLAGTSSDNVGVTQVTWVNSLGGSGTATGTTSWSVPSIALLSGTNVITITAYDASGNTATKQLAVSYAVASSDTVAPTVTITSPANNANVSNTSNTTFVATATDNVGVTEVKFFLGGTTTAAKCTLSSPTTAPSTYTCSFKVPSVFFGWGTSTITVQAKDAAGNTKVTSIKVR